MFAGAPANTEQPRRKRTAGGCPAVRDLVVPRSDGTNQLGRDNFDVPGDPKPEFYGGPAGERGAPCARCCLAG
jgi:hypothetical protein